MPADVPAPQSLLSSHLVFFLLWFGTNQSGHIFQDYFDFKTILSSTWTTHTWERQSLYWDRAQVNITPCQWSSHDGVDCISTATQSTPNLCACLLSYTVYHWDQVLWCCPSLVHSTWKTTRLCVLVVVHQQPPFWLQIISGLSLRLLVLQSQGVAD